MKTVVNMNFYIQRNNITVPYGTPEKDYFLQKADPLKLVLKKTNKMAAAVAGF